MSEELRIALVAEGPTDLVMIEAALRATIDRHFVITLLQPEHSRTFEAFGAGWGGRLPMVQAERCARRKPRC